MYKKSIAYVFREAKMNLSAHLVPCLSENDPSYTLLKGAKLTNFGSTRDVLGNNLAGGKLGSTTLLNNISILLRMTIVKNVTDSLITHVQIDTIFQDFQVFSFLH